ncbi:MAG: RluA family pseudouridine synthase [Planctomycetes bacterium]|nr:RluA family pseudouridine synthase [Planctomycetota bacterium]
MKKVGCRRRSPRVFAPETIVHLQDGGTDIDFSRPLDAVRLAVLEDEDGMRLDAFLAARMPWRSRTEFQRMVARGEVHREKRRAARASARLRAGEAVVVTCPPPLEDLSRVAEIPLRVLYEDPWILALDKPPGVVVHPTGRRRHLTLLSALHLRYRGRRHDDGEPVIPRLVHRLDRDTSGVLLATKRSEARGPFQSQFEARESAKEYLALVAGSPPDDHFAVDLPLGRRLGAARVCAVGVQRDGGAPALTRFEVLLRLPGVALVRARPVTGRQHQIRVHLEAVGCPVLGDRFYSRAPGGAGGAPPAIARHALHAWRLRVRHPFLGRPLLLEAALPADMALVIAGAGGDPSPWAALSAGANA